MTQGKLLKLAGLSPERASLIGAKHVRAGKVDFLVRRVAPVDFLGTPTHPFMPVRDGRDGLGDREAERLAAKTDWSNPEQARAQMAKVKEAWRPVFLKAILWPKVTDKEEPGTVAADDLFCDFTVAAKLFEGIMEASLGRRPPFLARVMSSLKRLWSSTSSPAGTPRSPTSLPDSAMTTSPLTASAPPQA